MTMLDRENRFAPGKLWSLLDMMELRLKKLLTAGEILSHANYVVERFGGEFLDEPNVVASLVEQIKTMRSELDNLQLGGASVFMALERLEGNIKLGGNKKLISQYIYEFKKILFDELSGTYVLTLSHLEQRLFKQSDPLFGKDVANL